MNASCSIFIMRLLYLHVCLCIDIKLTIENWLVVTQKVLNRCSIINILDIRSLKVTILPLKQSLLDFAGSYPWLFWEKLVSEVTLISKSLFIASTGNICPTSPHNPVYSWELGQWLGHKNQLLSYHQSVLQKTLLSQPCTRHFLLFPW